jgi:hypothetical protein
MIEQVRIQAKAAPLPMSSNNQWWSPVALLEASAENPKAFQAIPKAI